MFHVVYDSHKRLNVQPNVSLILLLVNLHQQYCIMYILFLPICFTNNCIFYCTLNKVKRSNYIEYTVKLYLE